jgi:Ala-tRNA(Pro) deacylase
MTAEAATRVLQSAGVSFEVLEHTGTESAIAEADVLGLSPAEVAKTVVLTTPAGYVRAVLPASDRIDLHKVRGVLGGGKHVHLATEEELARDYPEFDLGAIPPFAGHRRDPVLVDRRLAERESLVLEAGSRTESVRMQTGDLVRLTEAEVVDICQD